MTGLRDLRGLLIRLRRRILARSGPLARLVLYPNPFASPAYARTADIARDSGLGDVVLCTPGLRALKAANPRGRIRFYTDFPDLVRGLPYIDEVHAFADRPPGAVFVEYTNNVPSPVHIARLMGDRMGVGVTDTRPDCVVDPGAVAAFRQAWLHLPRPWIVVLRRASRFTPNKDWPEACWTSLVADLCRLGSVIEIGGGGGAAPPAATHLDLRGATTIAQMVAMLAAADIHVGPVSGPLHIAAAMRTPSVVVIGGYEHPDNAHYPGNIAFYTPVPCAPCWLREPCPFDIKCLRAIRPGDVADAVRATWARLRAEQPAEPAEPADRQLSQNLA